MIAPPKLSYIPFEIVILGSIGYALGSLRHVNEKLSAGVLVIASISNYILFRAVSPLVQTFTSFSAKAAYAGTNAFISVIAILAAKHFDLISERVAGALIFISAGILLARISLLNKNE